MHAAENVSLAPLTTFKIGGRTRFRIEAHSRDELAEAVSFAKGKSLPFLVLAGGSNVLMPDEDFEGVVIAPTMGGVSFFARDSLLVEASAEAGANWDTFVRATLARGLHGLENLSGIPGSVGATPTQNVGAYGAEVKDSLSSVEAFDTQMLTMRTFSRSECAFGYRESFFKSAEGKRYVITKVSFTLEKSAPPNLSYRDLAEHFRKTENEFPTLPEVRDAVLAIRARKFPDLSRFGTAGSFFKNPVVSPDEAATLKERFSGLPSFAAQNGVKLSLAWMLDNVVHAKGRCVGDACVWDAQPLVIVNKGRANAADVIELARGIEEDMREKTGISIEKEVRIVAP
jgi:UDP-N-acetylmuramate dehydrogenase